MMEHFRPQLRGLFVVQQNALDRRLALQVFSPEQPSGRQNFSFAIQSQPRLVLPSGRRRIDNTIRHRRCRCEVQAVALFDRCGCRGSHCCLRDKAEHTLQEFRPAPSLPSAF